MPADEEPLERRGAGVERSRGAARGADSRAGERRRAECLAKMQTDVVQLALDLLVREPDIEGFFGALTKTMVEEGESHTCGVWLIDDERRALRRCGWRTSSDRLYTRAQAATGTTLRRSRARAWPTISSRTRRAGPDDRVRRRRSRGCPRRFASSAARRACTAIGRHAAGARRPHARVDDAVEPARRPTARASGGASCSSRRSRGRRRWRCIRAALVEQQPRRGAAQGDPRRAQPARARHSRQPRAGIRARS